MSWSFSAIGTCEQIERRLEKHGEMISKNPDDYCRKEFEMAKPHLVALVKQNFSDPASQFQSTLVELQASGSASRDSVKTVFSSCQVSIKPIYTLRD